jgi:hypothetical protein
MFIYKEKNKNMVKDVYALIIISANVTTLQLRPLWSGPADGLNRGFLLYYQILTLLSTFEILSCYKGQQHAPQNNNNKQNKQTTNKNNKKTTTKNNNNV